MHGYNARMRFSGANGYTTRWNPCSFDWQGHLMRALIKARIMLVCWAHMILFNKPKWRLPWPFNRVCCLFLDFSFSVSYLKLLSPPLPCFCSSFRQEIPFVFARSACYSYLGPFRLLDSFQTPQAWSLASHQGHCFFRFSESLIRDRPGAILSVSGRF